ncbi:MAG: SDR family NAD(P)-dependent oxidoreductase [Thermoleophilia bacterium]
MDGAQASARLAGRVALVTGSSRGIGAAIAERLALDGAAVAINYRSDRASAERLVERLGPTATAWQADVGDTEQASRLVADVAERYGRLDVLVSNAGVWHGGRIDRVDPDDWRAVVDTSLLGAFTTCRAAVPLMRTAGFGRIVVISSVVGLIGFAEDTAYAAAKAASSASSRRWRGGRPLRRHRQRRRPRVHPDGHDRAVGEAEAAALVGRAAIPRAGRVEDVAAWSYHRDGGRVRHRPHPRRRRGHGPVAASPAATAPVVTAVRRRLWSRA